MARSGRRASRGMKNEITDKDMIKRPRQANIDFDDEDTIRYKSKDIKPKIKANNNGETQVISQAEINEIREEEMNQKTSKQKLKAKKRAEKIAKKEAKEKRKFKYKHPRAATTIKIIILLLFVSIIIAAGVFAGNLYGSLGEDLKIEKEELVIKYDNSYVYDKDGNQLAILNSGEKGSKRKIVSMSEMSTYLPRAYVSFEDERFYEHNGVDIKRTLGAAVTFILHAGDSSFGGSTITQQLIKNVTDNGKERSGSAGVQRKIKEMAKAIQAEQMLSKDQILELYLNTIFVGGQDVNGVALGAVYYFDKDVKDLTLAECAFMAGINNRPNYYNPFSKDNTNEDGTTKQEKLDEIHKRVKIVLNKMKERQAINEEEYKLAIADVDAGLNFKQGDGASATVDISYHTEAAIKQILKQLQEEKEMSKDMAEVYLFSSGLKIYTTQDTWVQDCLEDELVQQQYVRHTNTNSDKNGGVPQQTMACMTIVEPETGYVVATGAGTDDSLMKTRLGYLNWPTEEKKSTGSSIKPLAVIAPGLQYGALTAATSFFDGPTTFPGGYSPKEWFGGFKNDSLTMRDAVAYSVNIPHVKGLSTVGVEQAYELCGQIGMTGLGNEGLSLALGGLDEGMSTLQMASAYAMIANDGTYIEPTFYTKVTDKEGNIILEPHQEKREVMSPQNAYIEQDMLKSVVDGHNAAFGHTAGYCQIPGMDTAAKTGTTNGDTDRWLCGFTKYYSAAVWFGYQYSAEVTGFGQNPAGTIWANVMKAIHTDLENRDFEEPPGITAATICRDTGCVAGPSCHNTYVEIFVAGTVPGGCEGHTTIEVCTETGDLATEYCPSKQTRIVGRIGPEEQNGHWTTRYNFNDEVPDATCSKHTKAWAEAEEDKKKATVPDVVGKTVSDAKKALNNAGFTSITVSPSDATGKVTKQSAKAGDKIYKTTGITLTADKGSSKPDNNNNSNTNNTNTNNTNTTNNNNSNNSGNNTVNNTTN